MNEQIVNYLATNRDKYPRAVLTNMLVKSGYNPKEIEEAASMVFGVQSSDESAPSAPFDFWNFSAKVVYASKEQRRKDFWLGFWAPILSSAVLSWLPSILVKLSGMEADLSFIKDILGMVGSLVGLAIFVAIFYLWNRRRSVSYGIIGGYIFNLFISMFIIGVVLSMLGFSFLRF
ncbi:hypothetical protein HGA34_01455 [Candidatus Falkowbacteria bacterium]|nr:hypothetical protein [Candidatus Falkowbacteria bacterium]